MLKIPDHWRNTKVVDLVEQARSQAGQWLPTRDRLASFSDWYYRKYFLPGKATPILHIIAVVGTIGYLVEYPHLREELEHSKH
jgi:hypothetical protein